MKKIVLNLALIFFTTLSAAFAESPVLVISHLEGSAAVHRDGEEISASEGLVIRQGDELRSTEETVIDVVREGQWGYRLLGKANSRLAELGVKNIVEMDEGNIIVHIKEMTTGEEFELQTPIAVAAVRGTQFWGRVQPVEGNSTATIAVRQGSIELTLRATGETVTLGQGQAADMDEKSAPVQVRPAIDAEMQAMTQADAIQFGPQGEPNL